MTGACSLCGKLWRERSPDCGRHDAFESKSAHYEVDGKLSRAEAEKRAAEEMARAVVGGGR